MSSWHSYPSVFAMGHKAVEELLLDAVIVEEKIDGSQFSFGRFNGELRVRSKGKEMIVEAPEKMFELAVNFANSLDVRDGWTYKGEFLSKPKHNALAYDRVPEGNIILFDINTDEESYLSYDNKKTEASRIGIEIVPLLFDGEIKSANDVLQFLEMTSILGGQKVEGVVIKNYARFGRDKKVLMGKFVSEAYKEVHTKEWGKANPKQGDIIQLIVNQYRIDTRWNKAIQHLAERGELENSPRDIGKLILEVKADIKKECEDGIKDILYNWAIDSVLRGCIRGLPEWYKEKLLQSQFNK